MTIKFRFIGAKLSYECICPPYIVTLSVRSLIVSAIFLHNIPLIYLSFARSLSQSFIHSINVKLLYNCHFTRFLFYLIITLFYLLCRPFLSDAWYSYWMATQNKVTKKNYNYLDLEYSAHVQQKIDLFEPVSELPCI